MPANRIINRCLPSCVSFDTLICKGRANSASFFVSEFGLLLQALNLWLHMPAGFTFYLRRICVFFPFYHRHGVCLQQTCSTGFLIQFVRAILHRRIHFFSRCRVWTALCVEIRAQLYLAVSVLLTRLGCLIRTFVIHHFYLMLAFTCVDMCFSIPSLS